MSLTIMTASITIRTVVMMLRANGGPIRRRSGRADNDTVGASGGVGDEASRFPSANSPRFQRRRAGRYDHAPGAVERAVLQFAAEQPLALEAAWQNEVGSLRCGEAEAGVVGRIAQKDDRAMAALNRRRKSASHQRSPDPELAAG